MASLPTTRLIDNAIRPYFLNRNSHSGSLALDNTAAGLKRRSFKIKSLNGSVRNSGSTGTLSPPTSSSTGYGFSSNTSTKPSWSVITEEISVGPFPRSPKDLELLVDSTGINAFILLETEEGVKQIGLDWDDFRQRVNQQGAVAIRLSLKADDAKDQAIALPEAVRAVAALTTLGYKVHISCTNGIHRSPLVALGYLTLVKGLQLTEAWQILTKDNPLVRPNIEVLKEVAKKHLVKEAFQRGIETDVSLSEAVSKAISTKATREAFEQLAAYRAQTETASNSASSAKDKLDFYARQLQSLKEKEETSRKAAAVALKEKEVLVRQIKSLGSSPSVQPSQSTLSLSEEASPAVSPSEIQRQIRDLLEVQSSAKKELSKAKSKAESLSEKYNSISSSIDEAKNAKVEAENRLRDIEYELQGLGFQGLSQEELKSKKLELSRKEADAKYSITAGQDKVDFFYRQLDAIKEKEGQAKSAITSAQSKLNSISLKIESLKKEATLLTVSTEDAPLSAESALEKSLKSESKAKEALQNAQEKLGFFDRRLELQKQKEEKANQKAEEKIGVFSQQVSDLKLKLAAADVLASENNKKIEDLSLQITDYQKKEIAAIESSKIQAERLDFFHRHVASLRKKEEAAKEAAKSAIDKAKVLDRKVAELASKEQLASEQIRSLNSKVATLVELNAEIGAELSETKERESQLVQVLEDGTGVLTKALEAEKTIKLLKKDVAAAAKSLEAERNRADRLAAELERELISAGKKPKHYNDIEKVPSSSELEKQLLSQLASTKQTLIASGSALGISIGEGEASQTLMRDVVLGALSMAAVPFTLMSIFSDAEPSRLALETAVNTTDTITTTVEVVAAEAVPEILTVEEVLPPKPLVQPTSPSDFCKQTLSTARSARVEKFCNSLAEIALDS